jgi:flagellar motility protein MotE (MotC chaperone)
MKLSNYAVKFRDVSSLTLIIALFVGSATLRLTFSAGSAFAQSADNDVPTTPEPTRLETQTEQGVPTAVQRDRLGTLLKTLQDKQAQLSAREEAQENRQRALDDAAQRIDDRLAQIAAAEQQLRETLALSNNAAEDDLARLTTVYENMKPKDAAALFEAMKPEFAAGFLGRMRPDAAANIMAGLKPDFAYTISVILAGRNANAKKSG